MRRGMTLAEVMVSSAIVSFLLIMIVHFIIFYNQLKRGVERISDTTTRSTNISKLIKKVLYEKPDQSPTDVSFISNNNYTIFRIIHNNVVSSAMGFYSINDPNQWQFEAYLNNKKFTHTVPSSIFTEISNNQKYIIISVYANIYTNIVTNKSSKPKKVCFGKYIINIP